MRKCVSNFLPVYTANIIMTDYGLGLFIHALCLFLFKDSVLVIPEDSYSPELLNPKALDKALDFINQCGDQGFHIEYACPF